VLLSVNRRDGTQLEPAIPSIRNFDIAGEDVVFQFHQVQADFDPSSVALVVQDDLLAMPELLRLSAREWQRFLIGLFGTAAVMLKLKADVCFVQFATALIDTAKRSFDLQIHQISGFRIKVGTVSTRAKVRSDDLLVCFGGEKLTIGRIADSHNYLLRPNPANEIITIGVPGNVTGAAGLLLTADGSAKVIFETRDYPSFEDFHETCERDNFDLISVFSAFGSDGLLIAPPRRRETHHPSSFHDRRFNIRFDLTTGLSLEHGFFASGWFFDPDDEIASVTVADHTLVEPVLSDNWKIFHGKIEIDAEKLQVRRFVSFQPRQTSTNAPDDIRIRVALKSGLNYVIAPHPIPRDALTQRGAVLDTIAGYAFSPEQFADVFQPALEPLVRRLNVRQKIRETRELGIRSSRKISLIIPIYRELSFIRSQLAAFALDPYIRSECQIIYANDDPSSALRLTAILSGYVTAFPLDIKIITLDRNGGYALANNVAAREADGGVLILLNSDVVPVRQGWIEAGIRKLGKLPAFSVVGAKLLYPDGTLQHAGMYFQRNDAGYWQNMHFWKGYGRDLAEANVDREVPAVTGACMFIRGQEYFAIGGFSDDYIIGDFEDSDLCLKLRDKGGLIYYLSSIELYHFERQSISAEGPAIPVRGSTLYNEALHAAKWGTFISQLSDVGAGAWSDLGKSEDLPASASDVWPSRRMSKKIS
jgi:GT2 family glycosyltransferase